MSLFNKPLVSVVLASYNHVRFIRKAVESVLNQTMKSLELLVLDDGSTDGTADIVAKIKDKRLKLIRLSPNRRYHPRNIGIKMARGKYIAFQNSDDVWLKDKLAKQLKYFSNNPDTVLCFTRLNMIDEKGKIIKKSWAHGNLAGSNMNNDAWLRQLFIAGYNFGIASALVRKDKINKLKGFNETMVQMSDYDLWIRLLGLGQLYIIEEPLTQLRATKNNYSYPRKEVFLRSALENVDILNRYTEWPISKYLPNIFPDIMPKKEVSLNIQLVALARYAWRLKTPHHAFFSDQLLARLFNNPRSSHEILEYFGAGLKKEYIENRGKLKVEINK
ncbi:glycosyltransferase [Candidatus Roizmanbacteria bacterium]|nr:glycosyltransferase [Candidatus Roizmanbacteria bacterium]